MVHFYLKPEGVPDFIDGVRGSGGDGEDNYPQTRATWYALANGGHGPEFVLVTERKNISELQAPAKTLDQMMQEVYGAQGATVLASLRKAYYHADSQLLHFRSDLSYMPANCCQTVAGRECHE